jgi:hypothetical protein
MNYIRVNSGFEAHRPYIGMSHLSSCLRGQFFDYMNGLTATDHNHLGAFAGYTFEGIEKQILFETGVIRIVEREIVAPFDNLVRGHIDAETVDGDLCELKSVNARKFERVEAGPLKEHIEQVQAYMHFGGYKQTLLVYVCRDTFENKVFTINYLTDVGEQLEWYAKVLVDAIHNNTPPACTCRPGHTISHP